MESVKLSNANQAYLNKQKPIINEAAPSANQQPIENDNKKIKLALAALGAVGVAITAGVAIIKHHNTSKIIEEGKEQATKLLSDIDFNKGIASLKDGTKFTGVIEDTLKNGDKITMQYADGVLKKSLKAGDENFEKVYETLKDGSKIVTKTQGENVVKTNITEIQNNVKKAQKDLKELLNKKDELDISEFKNQADTIEFKSKTQQGEINDILAQKQKALDGKKAQEEAQKVAQINHIGYKKGYPYKDEYLEYCKSHPSGIDKCEIDFIKKYQNYTYNDMEKIISDNNDNMLAKFWISAKRNAEKTGSSVYVDEIPDIFKGIPKEKLSQAIDDMVLTNTIGSFKIGDKVFKIKYLGEGTYSSVYKISDGINKPVVLKRSICSTDRAYCNEILLSKKLKDKGIVDIPKFYMGNPISEIYISPDGYPSKRAPWQILDYVSEEDSIPQGKKLFEYLSEINGSHTDFNKGSMVGNYIVDLGGINGKGLPNTISSTIDFCCQPIADNGLTIDEFLKIFN